MTLEFKEAEEKNIIHVKVSGKLTKQDYEEFVPRIEKDIQAGGKVRILFEMQDFHGWDASGLWEDMKFDVKHFSDIERLAMVGDKKWEKGMSVVCKPFTSAEIRFFRTDEIVLARSWLNES